jgi:hypothetical protein
MNIYTTETFQKLTKRPSAKHSQEEGYKTKYKSQYSEQRRVKRDWEQA